MLKITNKYWYLLVIYAIISAVSNAGLVYGGYKLSSVVDGVFLNDLKSVTKDTIIVTCSFLITFIFHYFSSLLEVFTTKKLNIELRNKICKKINSLSDDEFNEFKKGDFISWFTNDVESVGNLCFKSFFAVLNSTSAVILSVYAVFTFHWIIGLSLFGVTLLMIIFPSFFQVYVSNRVNKMSKGKEEFSQRIENLLNGYRIFSYTNEKRIFTRLIQTANVKVEKSIASYGNANALQNFVLFGLFISSQMIMLFVSIFLALQGYTEKGAMLAVANISGTFFNGVNGLFGSLFTVKAGAVIIKKFEISSEEKEYIPNNIEFNSLEIKNLDYKVNGKDIFSDFNLDIEKNKKYLILGESGRGKTTLFKIIFGLIDQYEGQIELNKTLNYKDVDKRDIKNLISYLPQETIIFNDTLRNNISLFNPEISDEKIIEALNKVNLSKWLEENGLDAEINSESKNLSGGEMQRIAIARALVHNKEIMILDEITANLDKNNREIIENLVGDLNKTILYISHTTNSDGNKNFDQVIKL